MKINMVICLGLAFSLCVFGQAPLPGRDGTNNVPMTIDLSRVAQIVLCEESDPFGESLLQPLGVVITDHDTIQHLVGEINESKPDNGGYPFIGILCRQMFLDAASNVLTVSSIINYKATVECERGGVYFRNGNYYLTRPDGEGAMAIPASKSFRSVPFARTIFECLKKHRPDIIDQQSKLYGEPVEQVLGL